MKRRSQRTPHRPHGPRPNCNAIGGSKVGPFRTAMGPCLRAGYAQATRIGTIRRPAGHGRRTQALGRHPLGQLRAPPGSERFALRLMKNKDLRLPGTTAGTVWKLLNCYTCTEILRFTKSGGSRCGDFGASHERAILLKKNRIKTMDFAHAASPKSCPQT